MIEAGKFSTTTQQQAADALYRHFRAKFVAALATKAGKPYANIATRKNHLSASSLCAHKL